MVTLRLAALPLGLAARRWPADLRAGIHRELVGRVRQRWAWVTGILGALIAADAAVAVAWLTDPALDASGSPMWMVAALTGSGFGLPHPDAAEIFIIEDDVMPDPSVYLILAALALGAVIAARPRLPGRDDGTPAGEHGGEYALRGAAAGPYLGDISRTRPDVREHTVRTWTATQSRHLPVTAVALTGIRLVATDLRDAWRCRG